VEPGVPGEHTAIARREWGFVLAVVAAVLVVASLPYAFAYLTAPAGRQFMGILVNVPDHAQYFSWYWDFQRADLAVNRLTPEPNAPVFFNLLWWALGKVGSLFGWDYATAFQLLRLVATAGFMLVAYRLIAWFLADVFQRRVAFLLAVFASGFGWVLIVARELFNLPQLLWGTPDYPLQISLLIFTFEPNSFYGMLTTPHLVGAALYMLAFDLILRAEDSPRWALYAIGAGLWAQFMGWQHGYDLFLIWGISGAYGVLRLLVNWPTHVKSLPPALVRVLGILIIVVALSFPPGLYSFLLTSLDPIWRGVLSQFDNAGVFTPPPWTLWVLMGPAFLLALAELVAQGLFRLRGLSRTDLFLTAWFWANFLLVYLPTDYQIKMLNGWQVPVAILATRFVFNRLIPWLAPRLSRVRPLAWAVVLLAVVTPTNLYLFAWRFYDLRRYDHPYFLRSDEVAALDWLREHGQGDDVVLASLDIGQYVPALTGQHAFLAHWAQTVDFFVKRDRVAAFFDPATPETDRRAALTEYSVDYVVVGPQEQTLGAFDPASAGYPVVFTQGAVAVYQVP
jgi:hypothetical protein